MNNRIYSFLVFFFLTFVAINYFPKDALAEEMNIIQKSDDVVVVSNPKTPELKMRIVFKEELSIGEVEGDENYMFGNSVAFNTDKDGNFYVSDLDTYRILKYDPEGKYLLAIGREGQGPGEFQTLYLPRFDKDNNLYVTDARNNRISFFDKDGKYLRQIRMTERYLNPFINSKGYIVANKFSVSQEGSVQKQIRLYGLFDDKFKLIMELYKNETEMSMPAGMDESSIVQFLTKVLSQAAFRPDVRYTLANNDFIYLGYPDKYEINVYSPEGKLVKKITRDYDPLPVSKKDKESFADMAIENLPNPPFTEEMKKKAFKKIKYPKHKPAYLGFSLMENGWLAVIVDSVEDEYTLFDIFDQEGKYIAHFKTLIPAEGMLSLLLFFKNGKAYSVVTEDDYKFVKRYNFEIQEYKDNKWVKKK